MRHAGGAIAPERVTPDRTWVDVGVDETWERSPASSNHLSAGAGQLREGANRLLASVDGLLAGMDTLPADVDELPAGVDGLPAGVDELPADVDELLACVDDLPAGVDQPPAGVDELPVGVLPDQLSAPATTAGAEVCAEPETDLWTEHTAMPTGSRASVAAPGPVRKGSGTRALRDAKPGAHRVAHRARRPLWVEHFEWESGAGQRSEWPPSAAGDPPRPTVAIRVQGAERDPAFVAHRRARRSALRAYERPGFRPDRAAMWAVVLGLVLMFIAAATAHAAVRTAAAHVGSQPVVTRAVAAARFSLR